MRLSIWPNGHTANISKGVSPLGLKFREIEKETLKIQAPPELAEILRNEYSKAKRLGLAGTLSEYTVGLLCGALRIDPSNYGLASKAIRRNANTKTATPA
jgi:hypothetical protein